MLLGIGKFLLRLPDSCQSLVETINGSLANTFHRTAAVEDYHIEDLSLLIGWFILHFV
jgi:hypothetical protein